MICFRKVEVFDSLLELSWTFMSSTSVILQNQIITTLTSLAVQFEIVVSFLLLYVVAQWLKFVDN